jgi:hypothetical protein
MRKSQVTKLIRIGVLSAAFAALPMATPSWAQTGGGGAGGTTSGTTGGGGTGTGTGAGSSADTSTGGGGATSGGGATGGARTATDTRNDDHSNWGWVGLLGLLGLAGLMKGRRHDHVTHTTTGDVRRT